MPTMALLENMTTLLTPIVVQRHHTLLPNRVGGRLTTITRIPYRATINRRNAGGLDSEVTDSFGWK